MKEKNKRLMIIVGVLLLVIGVSFAFFTGRVFTSGNGGNASFTTANIEGAELKVEGTLEFNDTGIYPGHQNISSIKVTATGKGELIPYKVVWNGTNTISSLNYVIYKTTNKIDVSATCEKKISVANGAQILKEECSISNINQLGVAISRGTINKNDTKAILSDSEFITATEAGKVVYYYVILEYPNKEEDQNADLGGSFNGKVTVEKNDTAADIRIAKVYQEQNGSYQEVTGIPTKEEKYVLNEEKSTCTNSAKASWDSDSWSLKVGSLTTSGTECNLYFDKGITKEDILASLTKATRPNYEMLTENTTGTIFTEQDDDGETYYYAGAVDNNWIKFAGYYWRIIRFNGDGSIRLIYNGTTTDQTGETTQIGTSLFNDNKSDNAYVGYMYGTPGSDTYEATHMNTNNSAIKTILDNWYKTNIVDKGYANKVDMNAGFCGDREQSTDDGTINGSGGFGTVMTRYGAYIRYFPKDSTNSNPTPALKCKNTSDLYTFSTSSKGNKALIYPVGLITADEVAAAGGIGGMVNTSYYLYTNQAYWTISSAYFANSDAAVFVVENNGKLYRHWVNMSDGVRPVINLKADTMFDKGGNGTSSNPYVVAD